MSKRYILLCMVLFSFISVCSCSSGTSDSAASESSINSASITGKSTISAVTNTSENTQIGSSQLILKTITSQSIASNLLNESTDQTIEIYLPPTYSTSTKSYPVVYYLHGFGEPAGSFLDNSKNDLDTYFANNDNQFIIVCMNGQNKSGGSFYVNSPVIGNWEDYVTNEVVNYIDNNYRTIKSSDSRGICGHSMGGFGAINIALKHPEIFGSVYAASPGIFSNDNFAEVLDSWKTDTVVLQAYGQAFCPDPDGEPPYCKIPESVDAKTSEQKQVLNNWIDGYGNFDKKLNSYLAKNKPLRAIGFSYGTNDSYTWIPKGTKYFINLLKKNKIEPTVYEYEGDHEMPSGMLSEHLIPFFNKYLDWQK